MGGGEAMLGLLRMFRACMAVCRHASASCQALFKRAAYDAARPSLCSCSRRLRWYERCGVKVSCADCVAKVGESKILVAGPLPGPQPVTQLPEAKQLPAGQVLQAAVGGQP